METIKSKPNSVVVKAHSEVGVLPEIQRLVAGNGLKNSQFRVQNDIQAKI